MHIKKLILVSKKFIVIHIICKFPLVSLNKIYEYGVINTKLEKLNKLSKFIGANVFIKREELQVNKSFKCRGAVFNMLSKINNGTNISEFICASTGNHAQGFALSCAKFKKNGVIFMPQDVPQVKYSAVQNFSINDGVDYVKIILTGNNFNEALESAIEYQKAKKDSVFIHPYDDIDTINGQSSIMLEIYKSLPDVDMIFSSVGGGGLLAGIISAIKNNSNINIVACQSDVCHPLEESLLLKSRIIHDIKSHEKIADGSVVRQIGDNPWEVIKDYNGIYHETLLNSEILYAIGMLYSDYGIESEGAGALSLAGLIKFSKKYDISGKNIVIINSGGNVSSEIIARGCKLYQQAPIF